MLFSLSVASFKVKYIFKNSGSQPMVGVPLVELWLRLVVQSMIFFIIICATLNPADDK